MENKVQKCRECEWVSKICIYGDWEYWCMEKDEELTLEEFREVNSCELYTYSSHNANH